MVEPLVVAYEDRYATAFRDLNLEWIERFFVVEPEDSKVLDDPRGEILERGGEIFVALVAGEPVGTAAMIPVHDDPGGRRYELAKMAVTPDHQGLGLGRRLLESCLDFARGKDAAEVLLVTNSVLEPAVTLYESFGFRPLERMEDRRYSRGNLEMRLRLG